MAPEYVMFGSLSMKADVFSFGVLVLELISGQKNSNFTPQSDAQSLLEWVSSTSTLFFFLIFSRSVASMWSTLHKIYLLK